MKTLSTLFLIAITACSCDFESSNIGNTYSDLKLFKNEVIVKNNSKSLHHVVSENVWSEKEQDESFVKYNPKQLRLNLVEETHQDSKKMIYNSFTGDASKVDVNTSSLFNGYNMLFRR